MCCHCSLLWHKHYHTCLMALLTKEHVKFTCQRSLKLGLGNTRSKMSGSSQQQQIRHCYGIQRATSGTVCAPHGAWSTQLNNFIAELPNHKPMLLDEKATQTSCMYCKSGL